MSADAYLLKGVALAQMSSPDLATESFQKAIGIEPDNAKARFNLAVHFSRIGQKQGALTEAREALRVDRNHAGARDLVTQLEAEMGVAASTPSAPDGAPPIQGATGSTYQSNPYQSGPTASYNREGYAPKVHTLTVRRTHGLDLDHAWLDLYGHRAPDLRFVVCPRSRFNTT